MDVEQELACTLQGEIAREFLIELADCSYAELDGYTNMQLVMAAKEVMDLEMISKILFVSTPVEPFSHVSVE